MGDPGNLRLFQTGMYARAGRDNENLNEMLQADLAKKGLSDNRIYSPKAIANVAHFFVFAWGATIAWGLGAIPSGLFAGLHDGVQGVLWRSVKRVFQGHPELVGFQMHADWVQLKDFDVPGIMFGINFR